MDSSNSLEHLSSPLLDENRRNKEDTAEQSQSITDRTLSSPAGDIERVSGAESLESVPISGLLLIDEHKGVAVDEEDSKEESTAVSVGPPQTQSLPVSVPQPSENIQLNSANDPSQADISAGIPSSQSPQPPAPSLRPKRKAAERVQCVPEEGVIERFLSRRRYDRVDHLKVRWADGSITFEPEQHIREQYERSGNQIGFRYEMARMENRCFRKPIPRDLLEAPNAVLTRQSVRMQQQDASAKKLRSTVAVEEQSGECAEGIPLFGNCSICDISSFVFHCPVKNCPWKFCTEHLSADAQGKALCPDHAQYSVVPEAVQVRKGPRLNVQDPIVLGITSYSSYHIQCAKQAVELLAKDLKICNSMQIDEIGLASANSMNCRVLILDYHTNFTTGKASWELSDGATIEMAQAEFLETCLSNCKNDQLKYVVVCTCPGEKRSETLKQMQETSIKYKDVVFWTFNVKTIIFDRVYQDVLRTLVNRLLFPADPSHIMATIMQLFPEGMLKQYQPLCFHEGKKVLPLFQCKDSRGQQLKLCSCPSGSRCSFTYKNTEPSLGLVRYASKKSDCTDREIYFPIRRV
jgi:hypothetical protein